MREYLEYLRMQNAKREEEREEQREKWLMVLGVFLLSAMFALFIWFSI